MERTRIKITLQPKDNTKREVRYLPSLQLDTLRRLQLESLTESLLKICPSIGDQAYRLCWIGKSLPTSSLIH